MRKVIHSPPEKRKRQCGIATVEATVVIPVVMIAFISLLYVIRIVSVYSRMQNALNQVAAELSHYSYIYAVSGLKQQHDELADKTKNAAGELREQAEIIESFYRTIKEISGDTSSFVKTRTNTGDIVSDLITEVENMQDSSEKLAEIMDRILQNPSEELQLIGLALSDSLFGRTKTVLFGAMAKSMLRNNLAEDLKVASDQLGKLLMLKGGIDQLDFSASTFFNDSETIDLIVEYTVKPGIYLFPEVRLRNRACMLSWAWGVEDGAGSDNENMNDSDSLWNIDKGKNETSQHLARGNKIDRLFAAELKKKLGNRAEITPENFKTIDLIEYAQDGRDGSLVMIFSLNPFLPSYSSKNAVIGTIRQNINKLSTFQRYEVNGYLIDVSLLSGNYRRICYIVIPENETLPESYVQAFEECRAIAAKSGVELIQVQKYGEYENAEETGSEKDM